MSMLLDAPPVRTGRCGLTLSIDGRRYRLRPAPPTGRGSKIWRLTVLGGQSRAGQSYSVCQFKHNVDCTCPDSTIQHAVCKHIRAMQALGLINPRQGLHHGRLGFPPVRPRIRRHGRNGRRLMCDRLATNTPPAPCPVAHGPDTRAWCNDCWLDWCAFQANAWWPAISPDTLRVAYAAVLHHQYHQRPTN